MPCKYFRKYSFAHFFSDSAIYSTCFVETYYIPGLLVVREEADTIPVLAAFTEHDLSKPYGALSPSG